MIKLRDITRLEIIDEHGREFGRCDLDGVAMSGQDDGRTLKIFLDYEGEPENTTITVVMAAIHMLEQGKVLDATETLENHIAGLSEDTDE